MKFEIGDRVVFYRRYEGCMDDHSMKMVPLGAVGTVKNTFNNRPPGQRAPLVQFNGFEFASVVDKGSLRIDVAMPKPGTRFRVKAGCAAAYKSRRAGNVARMRTQLGLNPGQGACQRRTKVRKVQAEQLEFLMSHTGNTLKCLETASEALNKAREWALPLHRMLESLK